jgi:hypothetical protein
VVEEMGRVRIERDFGFDERQAPPDLPQQMPVVSEVQPDIPPLKRGVVSEVGGLIEIGGDELAAAEVRELDTLPLLGVRGYIALLMSTLMYAFPKTGKTTLLLEMLREWVGLGYEILVFTEEARIAWEDRLSDPQFWRPVRFVLAMNADPRKLLDRASRGTEQIVVIDTLRPVAGIRDENDAAEVGRKLAPWLANMREQHKTLVCFHHGNKAGGDHGRGISGSHALFAAFDAAYEIQRVTGVENRRLIHGYARMFTPSDLLYERQEDGSLKVLGDPTAVQHDEVVQRVTEVVGSDWVTRKELQETLDEPKPSLEMLRRALDDLVRAGSLERDPAEDRRGVAYRWRQPDLPQPPYKGGNSGSPGLSAPLKDGR